MDVSTTVLYKKEKSHNELLNLINATVSHEMRNPLNSISAQNIENQALFKKLDIIIKDMGAKIESQARTVILNTIDKLVEGNKV